uniref:Uncharacterized protein n=1 Tax=Panagrellus redivivus TaxID=6233 RepID=A0A7E4UZ98_PANRE
MTPYGLIATPIGSIPCLPNPLANRPVPNSLWRPLTRKHVVCPLASPALRQRCPLSDVLGGPRVYIYEMKNELQLQLPKGWRVGRWAGWLVEQRRWTFKQSACVDDVDAMLVRQNDAKKRRLNLEQASKHGLDGLKVQKMYTYSPASPCQGLYRLSFPFFPSHVDRRPLRPPPALRRISHITSNVKKAFALEVVCVAVRSTVSLPTIGVPQVSPCTRMSFKTA